MPEMIDISRYCFNGEKEFKIGGDDCSVKTNDTSLCNNEKTALKKLNKNTREIAKLQEKLFAQKKEGVVFLFQAQDAAGKDGTIKAVLSNLSPHGVKECQFKQPSKEELAHDFLWRVTKEMPEKGEMAIFNRSHYEDVLIGKVHELYLDQEYADRIEKDSTIIRDRYSDIKHMEKYLYRNSIRIVKIFLNVSKDEQGRRFISRIDRNKKNWKFSESDMFERKYWEQYQEAYEDAINSTATKECPWYVVPADNKWYMRYVVSEIILQTLKDMNPQFPEVNDEVKAKFSQYRDKLVKESYYKNSSNVEREIKEPTHKVHNSEKNKKPVSSTSDTPVYHHNDTIVNFSEIKRTVKKEVRNKVGAVKDYISFFRTR